MLAGDFTTFTSPQCNGGRQVTLRAPYVNNRIDPALFSPAALNLAKRLPSDDRIRAARSRSTSRRTRDELQTLGQDRLSDGRQAFVLRPVPGDPLHAGAWLRRRVDNILKTVRQGRRTCVPLDDLRRDDGVQLVDRQLAAVRGQQGHGRQLPDPVLLAEGYRRERLQLRAGVHDDERHRRLPALSARTRRRRCSSTTPTRWPTI